MRRKENFLKFEKLEPRQMLATITVNTFADVIDAADGLTSLREAVIQSNTNAEDDVIVLQDGQYQLSIAGAGEDGSQTGDLDVRQDGGHSLTIRGSGMDQTTIDANRIDRIFHAHPGSKLFFEDLELTRGSAKTAAASSHRGGAIFSVHGELNLNGVRVYLNFRSRGGKRRRYLDCGQEFHHQRIRFLTKPRRIVGGRNICARFSGQRIVKRFFI